MSRPSPRSTPYHEMGLREKQAHALGAMREPSITCPACETQLPPADLPRHMAERCTGPREPHPAAKWVRYAEAVQIAGSKGQLGVWISRDKAVRTKRDDAGLLYLLRDLVSASARRDRRRRRRKVTFVTRTAQGQP
jgi:hypothetical protein